MRPIKLIYWERQQIQSTKSLLLQNRCCSTELWCYIIMVAYCCESKQRHICHSVSIGEEYLSKTDSLSVFETSAKCSFIMTRYFLIFKARLLKKKITQFNLYEIEILFEMHDHLMNLLSSISKAQFFNTSCTRTTICKVQQTMIFSSLFNIK